MILGIDQGTTGTTAVVLSPKGKILGQKTTPVRQFFPKPGWVEHDPHQIWKAVGEAVVGALKKAGVSSKKIRCIGLTNQRETVSLFENDKALHRFIVWQDRRTSDFCEKLRGVESRIMEIAGTPVDPYFSASKISWLIRELKLSRFKNIRFRTIDSFMISKMTGQNFIEATNASRTSLMDLRRAEWSEELFGVYDIPLEIAPKILPSQNSQLKTRGLSFLPDGIPVSGILGDQQAALFGQLGWKEGVGKITFGTGSFVLLNTGQKIVRSKTRLVSTLALQWANGQKDYALEGSVFICGAWIQWLRDQLGILRSSADSESLAKKVKSSEGVIVIPALSGMGAPFWNPNARGEILGLSRGSSKAHIARASLEALAFQNRALIDSMRADATLANENWRVDGGAAANHLLMQIQSNVLNSELVKPKNLEATAIGAALLAAHSEKILDLKEIEATWKKDRAFKPESERSAIEKLYQSWLSRASALGH